MIFDEFIQFCNDHHNPVLGHFHHPNKTTTAQWQSFPTPIPSPGHL